MNILLEGISWYDVPKDFLHILKLILEIRHLRE